MNTIIGTFAPTSAGNEDCPNATLERALRLHRAQLNVIPIRRDAVVPAASLGEYSQQRPTEDQVRAWFADGGYEVGLACGGAGQLAVVSVNEFLTNWFRAEFPTYFAETYRQGHSYFFYWLDDPRFKNSLSIPSAYSMRSKPILVHHAGNWLYAPGSHDAYGWHTTITDVPATYGYARRCYAFQPHWIGVFERENRMWRQAFQGQAS